VFAVVFKGPKLVPVRVTCSEPDVANEVFASELILLSVGVTYAVVAELTAEVWPPTVTVHLCPVPVPAGVGQVIVVSLETEHVTVTVSPALALSRQVAVTVLVLATGPKLVPVIVTVWLPSVGILDWAILSKAVMVGV